MKITAFPQWALIRDMQCMYIQIDYWTRKGIKIRQY